MQESFTFSTLSFRFVCQDSCTRSASAHVTRTVVLLRRTLECLRRYGVLRTVRQIECFLRLRLYGPSDAQRVGAQSQPGEEVLNLQPGELVEVKSESEIRRTLDSSDRARGLGFMAGMVQHCGKRYRVYKQVRMMLLEGSGEVRRLKNTVLLEGVICDGEHFVCDRSCFYFWKEAWLKRVPLDCGFSSKNPSVSNGRE